jgi:hypothetical protein
MKKSPLFLFSLFCCLAILAVGSLTVIQAQIGSTPPDSRTLVAMPPRAGEDGQLKIKPGEKYQTNIRVRNVSDKPITLRSYAQDFIVKEDGSTPIAVQDTVTNRWSLAQWMVITPNFHTLGPNETAEMTVLIEVPEDALPGGKYAMVAHEPSDGTDITEADGSGSGVSQRIGTLFYVIAEGPVNEEAYIRNFQFKKFQEFGPVPFSFLIRNQSDVHIHPRMNVDIFNMLGQKSDSFQVDAKNIFPLNSRDFAGKWEKIWGFGMYTAKLTASYGESGQVAVATANFWIIPVRIILSILFGATLLVVIVLATKRYSEKQNKLEKEKIKELQKKLDSYEKKS